MVKRLFLFLILILALSSSPGYAGASARHGDDGAFKDLGGLHAVSIDLLLTGDSLNKLLVREDIRVRIELALRSAGIKIGGPEVDCFLTVELVGVSQSGANAVFVHTMAARRVIIPDRHQTVADVWQHGSVLLLSDQVMSRAGDTVSDSVRSFCNDFLKANSN